MTDPVTISQYPQGFLAVLTSQPFVLGAVVSVMVALLSAVALGVTGLINAVTHGERSPLIKSELYMTITVSFTIIGLICMLGAVIVDNAKGSSNFDAVSNAYGITLSDDHDTEHALRPSSPDVTTSITFTDGEGKPHMGVLVRKGDKVTVYSNAANRLTPLKRATH